MVHVFASPNPRDRDLTPEYLAWVRTNPGGFVVNFGELPSGREMWWNTALCNQINRPEPARGRSFTRSFGKACSTDRAELERWVADNHPTRESFDCACLRVSITD